MEADLSAELSLSRSDTTPPHTASDEESDWLLVSIFPSSQDSIERHTPSTASATPETQASSFYRVP